MRESNIERKHMNVYVFGTEAHAYEPKPEYTLSLIHI